MIFTTGVHQSVKFQTFGCWGEISQTLYFDRLLLLKGYKVSAEKVQRSYFSWYWKSDAKFEEKAILFQKGQEFGEFWSEHSILENFHCDLSLLLKVFNIWPKTKKSTEELSLMTLKSMQNLKKSWLMVWKMTWGICQMLIRTFESVKIGTFMESFCPK